VTRAFQYSVAAAALTLLVGVIGGLLVPADARQAVWLGAAFAFAIQVVLFVVLFVVAFGSRPLLAHGLGMLGRFAAFAAVALFWIPLTRVPAAPLLFSLITVLFLTTLVEPIILFRRTGKS
jgi:hypothetical protein